MGIETTLVMLNFGHVGLPVDGRLGGAHAMFLLVRLLENVFEEILGRGEVGLHRSIDLVRLQLVRTAEEWLMVVDGVERGYHGT